MNTIRLSLDSTAMQALNQSVSNNLLLDQVSTAIVTGAGVFGQSYVLRDAVKRGVFGMMVDYYKTEIKNKQLLTGTH